MGLGRCERNRHDQGTTSGIDPRANRLSPAHFRSYRGTGSGGGFHGRFEWAGSRRNSFASLRSLRPLSTGTTGCDTPLPRACCCWCWIPMLSPSHQEGDQQQRRQLLHWNGWFSRRRQGLPRMIGRGCQYWQGLPAPAGAAANDWQGLPDDYSDPGKPDPDLPFFGLNPNSFGRKVMEVQVGGHVRLGPRGVEGTQV